MVNFSQFVAQLFTVEAVFSLLKIELMLLTAGQIQRTPRFRQLFSRLLNVAQMQIRAQFQSPCGQNNQNKIILTKVTPLDQNLFLNGLSTLTVIKPQNHLYTGTGRTRHKSDSMVADNLSGKPFSRSYHKGSVKPILAVGFSTVASLLVALSARKVIMA